MVWEGEEQGRTFQAEKQPRDKWGILVQRSSRWTESVKCENGGRGQLRKVVGP